MFKSIAKINRVAAARQFSSFKKVHVANPIVDIDGDEMTRVIWQWIKEVVSKPLSSPLTLLYLYFSISLPTWI